MASGSVKPRVSMILRRIASRRLKWQRGQIGLPEAGGGGAESDGWGARDKLGRGGIILK